MFRPLDKIAFCIFFRTSFDRSLPNKHLIPELIPFEYPPRTSILMFTCFISQPGYCCFNSHRSGAYFLVFSSSFVLRFVVHGQLISNRIISFLTLSTIRASILLALTSLFSAKTGTSQYAVMELFSVIGSGSLGEHQGVMDSARSYFVSSSKYKILSAALCLARYLVYARALQPVITSSTHCLWHLSTHPTGNVCGGIDFRLSLIINFGRKELFI